jgi:hypothetical protein
MLTIEDNQLINVLLKVTLTILRSTETDAILI